MSLQAPGFTRTGAPPATAQRAARQHPTGRRQHPTGRREYTLATPRGATKELLYTQARSKHYTQSPLQHLATDRAKLIFTAAQVGQAVVRSCDLLGPAHPRTPKCFAQFRANTPRWPAERSGSVGQPPVRGAIRRCYTYPMRSFTLFRDFQVF